MPPRKSAHDLEDIVRRDAIVDWQVKEQGPRQAAASVRRLLLRHRCPPDQEQRATGLVQP